MYVTTIAILWATESHVFSYLANYYMYYDKCIDI